MSGLGVRGLVALAFAASFVAGCTCGPPAEATITILSPTEGTTLTRADDTDTDVDGLQIEVEAASVGLGRGDAVDILVDGVVTGAGNVDPDGSIFFSGVTLTSGTHRLTAVSREGAVTSEAVTVIVDDSCATITFVMPEDPGTGRLNLGPADDTDGEMCGVTFETTVSIATDAGDGSEVRVFVNGTPRSSARVAGTAATLRGIALDNRGASPNTLSVTVTRPDGVECSTDFPAQIFVDCVGASCEITRPDSTTAYLNVDNDVSADPGFQGEFDVTTDSEGVGQPIRFIIDGDEAGALRRTPMMVGMGGVATFGNVGLSESLHRFVAECVDGAGNRTRSGVVEWTVDITPCDIAIASPDGTRTLTSAMDDTDPGTPGIQLQVTGDIGGAGCSGYRVGNCPTIGTQPFLMPGGAFDDIAEMPTDPMQELCAEVRDLAGNVGEDRVALTVRTDGPQLQIATPAMGACFNDAGGGAMSCIGDLDRPTATCEVAFSIYCTEVGVDVTLREMGMAATLIGGTAPCVADGSAPPPFTGRADFAMVSVPSRASLVAVAIEARQSADGLDGTTSRSFVSDCDPPGLTFSRPACGATLRPSSQDEDLGTPGFQYRVDVWNANAPKPPVDLVITDSGGGSVYTATSAIPTTGILTQFTNADLTAGGMLTMSACASDMIGNRGCNSDAPCTVTVADIPTLSITVPGAGAILSAGDDCDAGTAGMQIRVTANTDAALGSAATIQVGALPVVMTSVVAGGSPRRVTACVDAPEGTGLPVVVTVTDAVRGMAMATVTVTIDTLPPTTSISDFAPVMPPLDARGGQVNFTWTAVADAGGGSLYRYEARCSILGPITNETEWTAATLVATSATPAASGTMQMDVLRRFRLGEQRWCVLRGFDGAGAATPLPSTPPPSVTIQPTTVTLTAPGNLVGSSIAGIGDVNGDTFGDILVGVGTGTSSASVHFGSATGPSPTPSIVITGGPSFGARVASLGDVSGDGVPDFAVGQHLAGLGAGAIDFAGSVYVFFGRGPSDPAWPSSIDVNDVVCRADLCFTSATTPANFGTSIAPAGDFDGDGVDDFAIGANRAIGGLGRVFVIRGRSASTPWTPGSVFTVPGPTAPDGFMVEAPAMTGQIGRSTTTCGDLSGDARADLIIGAPGIPTFNSRILRVDGRVYPAATTGLVTILGAAVTTIDSAATFLGEPVACVGDYNGDGARDVAASYVAGDLGGVRVYLQNSGNYSAASSLDITNDAASGANDYFGSSIGLGYHPRFGRIGDLDGDGVGDLLCGAEQLGVGPAEASLFYGRSGAATTTRSGASASWNPATGAASARRIAAYIGDVTGDGFPDFAIGDPADMSNAGRVLIYY